MQLQEIITKVSQELNLPFEVVNNTYKGYWTYIRNTITELPLKEVSEEEFDSLRPNFNIPSLGKLSCTKERWLGVKKRYKYINNIKQDKNGTKYNKGSANV